MDDNQSPTTEKDDEESPGQQPGLFARIIKFAGGDSASDDESIPDIGATPVERALVQNIITRRGQRVEEVMIPRADISAVEASADLVELAEAFRHEAHSRLPVYRDTLDNVIGFVHVKDVALARGFGATTNEPFNLEDHVREMLVAPPSMPTKRLLQRMQASRIHMALVIDEYGGVDGLITIEDLVEQIVGEIEDEHDQEETVGWRMEREGVYICNARVELSEFEAEAGVDLLPDDLDEDVDTLGGLLFMLSNRIPARGEVLTHPDGHEFEIVDADPRRIKRLRVLLFGAERASAKAAE
jgi:magnesium and cobalt transporter